MDKSGTTTGVFYWVRSTLHWISLGEKLDKTLTPLDSFGDYYGILAASLASFLDLKVGFPLTSPDAPGIGPVSGHEGRREQRRHRLVKEEVILEWQGMKQVDKRGQTAAVHYIHLV